VMNVALPGVSTYTAFLGGGFLQLEKACSWSKGSWGHFVTKGHKCGFGTSKWEPNFTLSIVKLGNEKIYRKYEEWG
jgi:hypothetical protein